MKYFLFFISILVTTAFSPLTTFAANTYHQGEILVLAANNVMELDITMEMVGENTESSADIINVIPLPVQAMEQERIRNERHIRQDGEASALRQQQGEAATVQNEINRQITEAAQEASEAKNSAQKGK